MAEMAHRIRQLEEALAILQSGISNEPHPLLRDEFLTLKFVPDKGSTPDAEVFRDDTTDAIDAFGMLTIGDQGAKYYGPCAGTEVCPLPMYDYHSSNSHISRPCSWYGFILSWSTSGNKLFSQAGAEMDMSAVEHEETSRVSAEITKLSKFPFGAEETTGASLDIILNHLPPQPRAWSLYETYVEHASWLFGPVKRDEMIDDILSPIYNATKEKQTCGSSAVKSISPHKAAVLFFVFALGALVDLTLEPCKLSHIWTFPVPSHLAALYFRQHTVRDILSLRLCLSVSSFPF
jgi:hypothetical protein